jgi:predicted nucleic acid-binding protein
VVTYVLDASAILRFTDNEAGAERVQRILEKYLDRSALIAASAIHWGETANRLYKLRGRKVMNQILERLEGMGLQILPVTAEEAVRAAIIRADHGVPYVDAFGAALAMEPNHVFVTADFDLKPAAKIAHIEFLPAK